MRQHAAQREILVYVGSMTVTFRVHGLDCAEEAQALRRALEPVPGVRQVSFNILRGEVSIDAAPMPPLAVLADTIRKAGFDAVLSTNPRADGKSAWAAQRAAARLCGLSGLLVLLGVVTHAWLHGNLLHALVGGETETAHVFPLAVRLFYLAAIVVGGWRIAPKAFRALANLRADMNLLMTMAVIGAVFIGQWLEAAVVTFLFSLALWLESRSVARARRTIEELLRWLPTHAFIETAEKGRIESRLAETVEPETMIVIRPGDHIPLDGVVIEGRSAVNEAPITGEWRPVPKEPGHEVWAGTINGDGLLRVRVTRSLGDSVMARIVRIVEEAQEQRARAEQWVDRFARYYTPAMLVAALLVAVLPPLLAYGEWSTWFYRGLVLLVIACPCALVISTPVTMLAGVTCAARHGVLVKGGVYLEQMGRVRALAMDKTGTLTLGAPRVAKVVPMSGHTEEEIVRRAAALELHSNHPLARAIMDFAKERSLEPAGLKDYQALSGRGAMATLGGQRIWIGSHRLAHEMGAESEEAHREAVAMESDGCSVLVLGTEHHVCGLFALADSVRPEAKRAVSELRNLGVRAVVMLTGDHEETARAVATATGLEDYRAGLLPEDKVAEVKKLRAEYGGVAMIGDGVNDAPAMAAADVALAMGRLGSGAALEAADITLMADDLLRIPWLIRHSRRTMRLVQQNIAFALGVKAVVMLMAMAGYSTLWLAIAADMGVSLAVVANGLRALRG